jgi:hypothetical protein
MRGGYYPLKYNPEQSYRVTSEQATDMLQDIMLGRHAKAHTPDGMLKERVGSGGRPVWLDMSVFHSHINNAIATIALAEPVAEVQEVLASNEMRVAIESTGNIELLKGLDMWLMDVAAGEQIGSDIISKAFRRVRVGFSASKLGFNVGTILMQPLGVFQSIPVIGAANMLKGLKLWTAGGPEYSIQQIQEKSMFMRERGVNFNKDIRDTLDKLRGDPNKPGHIPAWARDSMFSGIIYTQRFVDVITWVGAYEKAKNDLGENATEDDLIHAADRAVARAQASGVWSDRTAIERGTVSTNVRQAEFVRGFTALGSYFFAKGNVAFQRTAQTDFKDPKEAMKYVVDMMFLFAVEAIIVAIARGQWPDEDDEENPWWFAAKETGLSVLATLPFLREAGSEISGFRGGAVVSSFWEMFGRVSEQTAQGEADLAALKAWNNFFGVLFRYPSGQINRVITAWHNEEENPVDYLIWREKE